MSLFFSLGLSDPVPFGVCGIETPEAGQFGSTSNNAYLRLFTNDNGSNYKILSGMALGSSNLSGVGTAAINNIYLGDIVAGTNRVRQTLSVQEQRVGVNYPSGMRAALDIYNPDSNSPIAWFSSPVSSNARPVVVARSGTLGIGTSNPDETKDIDLRGTMVACNVLLNTIAGVYPSNTINAGRSSLSNFDYLRGTHAYLEGTASNTGESLLRVRVPGFTALTMNGVGNMSIGSERVFDPTALLSIDGSGYACNLYINTIQGLQPGNTLSITGVTMSNARMFHGQTASLTWTTDMTSTTSNILRMASPSAISIVNAAGQWGIQTSNPHPDSRVDIIGALHACNLLVSAIKGSGTSNEVNFQSSILSNITRIEASKADLIYTGSSNTYRILTVTSSSSVLTALANGQIGIGTSTPNSNARVDILGAVNACNLRVNTLQSTLPSGTIDLLNETTLSNAVVLHTQQAFIAYNSNQINSNVTIFQANGTNTFSVLSSGRVGIQTTTPRSTASLDVRGNIWGSNATLSSVTGHLNGSNLIDFTLATASNLSNVHVNTVTVAHRFGASSNTTALAITNPTGDSRALVVTGDGRVGIGTTVPSSTSNLLLDIRGDVSACNLYLSKLTSALASSAIDFNQSSPSNLNAVALNQVRLAYTGATATYPLIDSTGVTQSANPITLLASGQVGLGTATPGSNIRLDVLGNIRASNLTLTSLTGGLSNTTIDGTQSTLSNLGRLITTQEIRMNGTPLFYSNGTINPQVTSTNVLSGSILVDAGGHVKFGGASNDGLYYNVIDKVLGIRNSNPTEAIDVNGSIQASISIKTSNIVALNAANPTIKFGYAKLLEIDQLIVRSNITIETPGINTITNLPTNIVRLSEATGTLDPALLPTNLVILNSNNQIDASLIPASNGPTTTLVRTTDAFGLGIRTPAQRLHVHNGNSVVTSGFAGVGLSNPTAVLHVRDTNGPVTTVLIEQLGNRNPVQILGPSSSPLLTMTFDGRVGIGTVINSTSEGLFVNSGIARFAQGISTPFLFSSINAQNYILSNLDTLQSTNGTFSTVTASQRVGIKTTAPLFDLDVRGSMNCTGTANLNRILPNNGSNTIVCAGAMYVQGSTTTPTSIASMVSYINSGNIPTAATNVGLYVEAFVQSAGYYATSDRRFKKNVQPVPHASALDKIANLEVCTYDYSDPRIGGNTIGFIAQDVKKTVPEAITIRSGFIPDIMQIPEPTPCSSSVILRRLPSSVTPLAPLQKVRIEVDSGPITATIQEVKALNDLEILVTFTEPIPIPNPSPVFVYGRWADDIHTMDYDRLVALNTSAIQALLLRVQELERKLLTG